MFVLVQQIYLLAAILNVHLIALKSAFLVIYVCFINRHLSCIAKNTSEKYVTFAFRIEYQGHFCLICFKEFVTVWIENVNILNAYVLSSKIQKYIHVIKKKNQNQVFNWLWFVRLSNISFTIFKYLPPKVYEVYYIVTFLTF